MRYCEVPPVGQFMQYTKLFYLLPTDCTNLCKEDCQDKDKKVCMTVPHQECEEKPVENCQDIPNSKCRKVCIRKSHNLFSSFNRPKAYRTDANNNRTFCINRTQLVTTEN